MEGVERPSTPAKKHWRYRRNSYKRTPRGCDCSDRSRAGASQNQLMVGRGATPPRVIRCLRSSPAQAPGEVPEEALSNRITAHRRACMEMPRGGTHERAGRQRGGLPGRKEDDIASGRSRADLREGVIGIFSRSATGGAGFDLSLSFVRWISTSLPAAVCQRRSKIP